MVNILALYLKGAVWHLPKLVSPISTYVWIW